MAETWTSEEVDHTVEVYFSMLAMELEGESFNKTQLRRQLRAELNYSRTDQSFEYKFQNISAVLQDLGAVYVDGYKPARNVQQLLRDRVTEQLERNPDIRQAMLRVVTEPASGASVLGDPVTTPELAIPATPFVPRGANIDFVEVEAANRSLGLAGEQAVVEYERSALRVAGRFDLADRVEHTSQTRGDGLGYDILSFEPHNGARRHIEVKTTRLSRHVPFRITRNELAVSESLGDAFVLCRVFRFRQTTAQQYRVQGPLGPELDLVPLGYLAYPRSAGSSEAL